MENTAQVLGFIGTLIVAGAYIPQGWHLVKKHCAYGISIKAWSLWLIASLLLLPQAILSGEIVFMILFLIQIVAISFILVFASFHQKRVCKKHKTFLTRV